jgi:hypothetical protein
MGGRMNIFNKSNQSDFQKECEIIIEERKGYKGNKGFGSIKFFDIISTVFLFVGIIILILVPFTEISLLQATCFFVISYTLSPTDLECSAHMIKGIAEDLGNIRANISVIRKRGENEKV